MAAHGLAAQGHRARLVGAGAVRGAELVITAERAHRAPVLALRPDLLRRTFTFAELVALAEAVSPGLAPGQEADALRAVVAGRGRYPVTAEDLPDPVDAGPAEHDLMVRTVLAGTDRLRAALTTGPGSISRA